jgi:hypothetical protein
MRDDRWLQWQAEYAGTNRLPGIWSTFMLLGLLAILAMALFAGPTATAQSGQSDRGSLCDQHRADPAWRSICREAARR